MVSRRACRFVLAPGSGTVIAARRPVCGRTEVPMKRFEVYEMALQMIRALRPAFERIR